MKYKKSVILLICFLLLTVSYFTFVYKKSHPLFFRTGLSQFLKNDSFREKGSSKKSNLDQTSVLRSCRTFSQTPVANFNLNRVQKLNRLMDVAINWSFISLNGEVIDLYCLRNKKRIVLNFWATWCPPCIKELSSLSQLAKENKAQIFVVAVSIEDKITVEKFLTRSFSDLDPMLKIAVVDEKEKLTYFPKDNLPVTYIFNTKGFLEMKVLGDRDWSDLNVVQSILELN